MTSRTIGIKDMIGWIKFDCLERSHDHFGVGYFCVKFDGAGEVFCCKCFCSFCFELERLDKGTMGWDLFRHG